MKICWILFGILVAVYIIGVTVPARFLHFNNDFRSSATLLGIIGAALLILAAGTQVISLLKSLFIITGAAAVGWPVSLLLHRLLYSFFPTEPVTYVLFFFICTPVFVLGAIGTVIIGIRQLVMNRNN